jgi:hypothetical protein
MKKLTKTLSLVLVIAMVLSLCVVGVSAKTFSKDGDQIGDAYKEAVDVMSGIGIISGTDTEGTTFNPTGNFTRAEAAKIIAYMVLGKDAGDALAQNVGTSMFKDMGGYAWAVPYVNYCAQKGIINGTGDGNFAPAAKLTGYAFAKMLLCAVGYGANKEYTGNGWDLKVATDAVTLNVFKGDMTGATPQPINREQAVLYAFNTLWSIGKVSYSALYGTYVQVASTATSGIYTPVSGDTLAWSMYRLSYSQAPVSWNAVAKQYTIGQVKIGDAHEKYGYNTRVWYTYDETTQTRNQVSNLYPCGKVLATVFDATSVADLTTSTSAKYVAPLNSSYAVYVNGNPVTLATSAPAAGGYWFNTNTLMLMNGANYVGCVGVKLEAIDYSSFTSVPDGTIDSLYYTINTVAKVTSYSATGDGKVLFGTAFTGTDWTSKNVNSFADLSKGMIITGIVYPSGLYWTKAASATVKVASADTTSIKYGNPYTSYTVGGKSNYIYSGALAGTADSLKAAAQSGKDIVVYSDANGFAVATDTVAVDLTSLRYIAANNATDKLTGTACKLYDTAAAKTIVTLGKLDGTTINDNNVAGNGIAGKVVTVNGTNAYSYTNATKLTTGSL